MTKRLPNSCWEYAFGLVCHSEGCAILTGCSMRAAGSLQATSSYQHYCYSHSVVMSIPVFVRVCVVPESSLFGPDNALFNRSPDSNTLLGCFAWFGEENRFLIGVNSFSAYSWIFGRRELRLLLKTR